MAPEQLRAEPLTPRADVFAWGVVAYELLSGAPPWGALQGGALVAEILRAETKPLRERAPEVAPDVEALVRRAMSKEPDARPSSVEIVSALTGRTPSARRISIPVRPASGTPGGESTRMQLVASMAPTRRGYRAPLALAAAAALSLAVAWFVTRTGPDHAGGATHVPPSPRAASTNAEASSAYHAALQMLRDATTDEALEELDRARAADPSFAAAHLRRAAAVAWMDAPARDAYEHAVQLRAGLDERDAALLDAIEPWARFQPDPVERARRLAASRSRWPADLDVALDACRALVAVGSAEEAEAACARALTLDPSIAEAWRQRALARSLRGDGPGANTGYAECLSRSPAASDCLRELIQLRANDGSCREALDLASRLVAAHPKTWTHYLILARTLAGAGEPSESIQVALDRAWERAPDGVKSVERLRTSAMLDELAGRFDDAAATLKALDAAMEPDMAAADHVAVARARWELAFEVGDTAGASRLAEGFLKKHAAWTEDARHDTSIDAEAERYRSGATTREQWAPLRDSLLARERARGFDSRLLGVGDVFRWMAAYVAPSVNASDARDALAVAPESIDPGAPRRDAVWEEAVGAVLALAGRSAEAAEHLARAGASCDPLANPIARMRALERLGAVRETLGDRDGACRAYASVVAAWRRARPRSVTAEDALASAKRLRCAG
jgi:tetratricopeptide (TPR) repeat protein